jgi:transcriptional regulator with XRE-family HTH domain
MTTLNQLIENSGMNKNQVSKISGISNTYLSKIEQFENSGNRIKIKRKTLINIAVSLNLSLVEINGLLMDYDHGELSTSDIPSFISASENQTVTGILPVFSSLVIGWFLIGMEKTLSVTEGASMEYVLDQPSHALKSPEHASFVGEWDFNSKKLLPLHKDLIESACTHRRKLITEALDKGNCIKTYICSNCFERYLLGWEQHKGTDAEEKSKKLLREHLQTLISYIENYPNQYQLRFLKKCPRTRYELLYMPLQNELGKVEQNLSRVIFLGRESLCNADRRILWWSNDNGFGQGFGDLLGFATDLQNLLDFFHMQHVGLKDHFVDDRFKNPESVTEHIRELMSKNIPENG